MPSFNETSIKELSIKGSVLPTTNLLLWLNSRNNVSISGSDVTEWEDYRKNGIVLTSSSGSRPTISSVNGIRSVAANGSQFLTNSTISLPNQYSVFVVANRTGSAPTFGWILNFSTGNYVFVFGASFGNFATFSGNGSGWNDTNANSPAVAIGSSLVRLTATNNNSTITPYVGSTAQNTKTGNTITSTGAILFTGGAGGAAQYWTGNLLELLIYDGVVSDTNRQAIWDYLSLSNDVN